MPFYEYQCSACEHYLEVLQKISDAPLRKCPNCGRQTLKRLISAPVFRLKGGGWYETDFKSDNEQKRNIHGREESEASGKADANASSGDGSKDKATETKPAETKAGDSKSSNVGGSKPAASSARSSSKPAVRAKPAKTSRPAAKVKPAKPARKRASR